MTYVITEPFIDVKDLTCVEVCPVDCIHPTEEEPDFEDHRQLYIDPAECIDCDACVEVCPVDAIFPEDQVPDGQEKFTEINAAASASSMFSGTGAQAAGTRDADARGVPDPLRQGARRCPATVRSPLSPPAA